MKFEKGNDLTKCSTEAESAQTSNSSINKHMSSSADIPHLPVTTPLFIPNDSGSFSVHRTFTFVHRQHCSQESACVREKG